MKCSVETTVKYCPCFYSLPPPQVTEGQFRKLKEMFLNIANTAKGKVTQKVLLHTLDPQQSNIKKGHFDEKA